jgi:hypothetical protein
LAAWPPCSGRRQPAASELGGGPVHRFRLTKLERLASPSAPCSAAPQLAFDLTPRTLLRAELCSPARAFRYAPPVSRWWLCLRDRKWLESQDRPQLRQTSRDRAQSPRSRDSQVMLDERMAMLEEIRDLLLRSFTLAGDLLGLSGGTSAALQRGLTGGPFVCGPWPPRVGLLRSAR